MKSIASIITACALAALANSSASAGNLLINGTFEDLAIPLDTFLKLPTIPGWLTPTAGAEFELWSGTFGAIPSSQGVQHLEINASHEDQIVLQSVAVTQGQLASFSFDYTGRFADNTFIVDVVGDTSNTHYVHTTLNPASFYASHTWDAFSMDFTPTDSSVTVSFRGIPNPALDAGGHIDNVSLTQIVPEPSSGLLGILGAAGLFLRRSRSASAA